MSRLSTKFPKSAGKSRAVASSLMGQNTLSFSTKGLLAPPNFKGHFLIAMPQMDGDVFHKTVTFVCEHNAEGAMGIVINRPLDLMLEAVFRQVDIDLSVDSLRKTHVYFGGPVQPDRGFVLHRPIGDWSSTLQITPEIGLTTSKDILQAVGTGSGPQDILLTLGYAGWDAGQLEKEIAHNSWLTVEADPSILFDIPIENRLEAAMSLVGVNFMNLMGVAGHD